MIQEAIYTLLKGSYPDTFPNKAPQDHQVPYQVYRFVSVVPHHTKSGVSTVDTYRMTISVYSTDYNTMVTRSAGIRTIIDGIHSQTVDGELIDSIIFDDYTDLFDGSEEDSNEIYQRDTDYIIRYKR